MEEAALWRAMRRQVTKGQPPEPKVKSTADRPHFHTAGRVHAASYQSSEDADCVEIDMIEEAKTRVYFGFYHLDWVNSQSNNRNFRTAFHQGSFTDVQLKKNSKTKNLNISNGDVAGHASYFKKHDQSAERSLRTYQSDRKRGLKDHTIYTELSHGTELPHVCSLYGEPAPLMTTFRDDQSRLPSFRLRLDACQAPRSPRRPRCRLRPSESIIF